MEFTIIKNSESKTGYDIEDQIFVGLIPGMVCGWQFEFVNSKGEINYGSVRYEEAMPEEVANEYAIYGAEPFETERMFGWEPTGRVVFRGYGEAYYDYDERDWFVNTVDMNKYINQYVVGYV